MNIEKELETIKRRIALLEQERCLNNVPSVLEMDLALPEADIGGLHFNETRVHAVFEQLDDGWFHSRDILFLSAWRSRNGNDLDVLMEYINTFEFKSRIWEQCPHGKPVFSPEKIEVSIPVKNEGVKKYNGVECGYWLNDSKSEYFCCVDSNGFSDNFQAFDLIGCAPVFRVVKGGN